MYIADLRLPIADLPGGASSSAIPSQEPEMGNSKSAIVYVG
jgi:hypothetical protein